MRFKKVIQRRADEFLRDHIPDERLRNYYKAKEDLGDFLYELDLDIDKHAFLRIVEQEVVSKTQSHISNCDVLGCPVENQTDDFLYEVNKQKNALADRDELDIQEIAVLNEYIGNLQDQIDLIGKSNQLSLELISDLKGELEELRAEMEYSSRKRAKRQFYGTTYEVFKVLSKLGLKDEEITEMLNKDITCIDSVFESELLMDSGKMLIESL